MIAIETLTSYGVFFSLEQVDGPYADHASAATLGGYQSPSASTMEP
jgi:hypothetical protein